jgi:hypothetical protein
MYEVKYILSKLIYNSALEPAITLVFTSFEVFFVSIIETILYDGEKSNSFKVSSSGKTYSISLHLAIFQETIL